MMTMLQLSDFQAEIDPRGVPGTQFEHCVRLTHVAGSVHAFSTKISISRAAGALLTVAGAKVVATTCGCRASVS